MEDAIVAMCYIVVVLISNLKHTYFEERLERPRFKDP